MYVLWGGQKPKNVWYEIRKYYFRNNGNYNEIILRGPFVVILIVD